jgi:hypothetical protein
MLPIRPSYVILLFGCTLAATQYYGRILALPDHPSHDRIECGSLPTLTA